MFYDILIMGEGGNIQKENLGGDGTTVQENLGGDGTTVQRNIVVPQNIAVNFILNKYT